MHGRAIRLLRFPADRRAIGVVCAYFATFIFLWLRAPMTMIAMGAGTVVLSSLSWFCAIITHNMVHCPMWRSRQANRVTQVALSLAYGFSVSDYVPGHNRGHHPYVQTTRDVMRTSKVRTPWNAVNLCLFFFAVAPDIVLSNRRFLKTASGKNVRFKAQRTAEVIIVWGVKAILLWLDWRRAIAFVFLPHLWAVWSITTVNYLQHDGCDPDHPYNHSRNFVGPLFNWFHFNNGFHAIHHAEPGLHWSLLPAAHATRVHPHVHAALEQQSLIAYLFDSTVVHGRRMRYDGTSYVLPEPERDMGRAASKRRAAVRAAEQA